MRFMDDRVARHAAQLAAAAADPPLVVDTLGRPAGHRPGFCIAADSYRADSHSAERGYYLTPGEAARQQRIIRQSEAWKSIAWAKQHKPKPGGLRRDAAPPPDRNSDAACQAVRDEAYRRRCERLSNAWRNT
jgi:hypothetical protein